ncbi:transmembrane protease serine 3-like isoform X1 [Anopheles funestus]|uniref:transmembrane protease serine 3-like isoform X1 n=1 Tax=Anopheles funestus TaxID=62324 RepID=UPI0020C6163C|nr:transmembrane protease serine 3-like isoform X1 [Anopheles funestus]
MAYFNAILLICSTIYVRGQKVPFVIDFLNNKSKGSNKPVFFLCPIYLHPLFYMRQIDGSNQFPATPLKSLLDNYVSIQQSLYAKHIRAHNVTSSKPTLSIFNDFVQQIQNSNHTSNLYKPVASEKPLQDEQHSSEPGPVQHGLGNFLLVLSTLSNRPLSDQSTNSSSGGIVSGGIAAVQETFSHVGSSIQSGINSVFGSNQANEASVSTGWNPVRPISSAFVSTASSQPSFCPTNCTMVCGLPQQTTSQRIVGGVDVTPRNKYPWLALLQYYGENVGTGTLINDRVVLTSGTIVSNMIIFKHIKVLFGVFDPKNTTENPSVKIFYVTRTKLHPQYSASNQFNYNIGLLQLSTPVTITDSFMPICLPTTVDTFSDAEAILAGWGARELGGESWKSLRSVVIPLYSFEECSLAYSNSTENNICGGIFGPAAKEQHKTSCDGDEGSGLMYPWKNDPSLITLIGITLQIPGVGCGRTNQPAIFTKVQAFIPWVRSQSSGCYCKS